MQKYLESRNVNGSASDLARHLMLRQHLGKTIIVCNKPSIVMGMIRRHWYRLARNLQNERAGTLNAEKILQLTYDITHMQHMDFTSKAFEESPKSDVFLVQPEYTKWLPSNCFNLYILDMPSVQSLSDAIRQLPEYALVVDYTGQLPSQQINLLPKAEMEKAVAEQWQKVNRFFEIHNLSLNQLCTSYGSNHIDETIDVILDTGVQFLRVSDDFLNILRLAQPLNTPSHVQRQYDLLASLNTRIRALTPGILSQQFTQNFGDDDMLFHDIGSEEFVLAMAL